MAYYERAVSDKSLEVFYILPPPVPQGGGELNPVYNDEHKKQSRKNDTATNIHE